jgi:hypothetical protein
MVAVYKVPPYSGRGRVAMLEDVYYNLVRAHKTLRQEVGAPDRRWLPRTPALTSTLTEHMWTVNELLSKIPVPIVDNS